MAKILKSSGAGRLKAFLSHSSRDKGFVDAVTSSLRPGSYEIDSVTFDAGLVNSAAIIASLKRVDLFCLFLSQSSVQSAYVDFETLLGLELIASGLISRFLAICLDENAFNQAAANVRFFNVVRKSLEPESVARLIQGNLIASSQMRTQDAHPFMGREQEMLELEKQVTDHRRPVSRALFISGNAGSGRRTIGQKFYEAQYPSVTRASPTIQIDEFSGLEELYRRILTTLRPTISVSQLKTYIQSFAVASGQEKARLVAQQLNSLLVANEVAYLLDNGGMLTDAGALAPEINDVLDHLESRPHPPAILIARRMIPRRVRRTTDDVSYLAVRSLERDSSVRLISKLLRDRGIVADTEDFEQLVKLCDGHPFNFYRMIDEINGLGVKAFLANPLEFIDWKHRQSSEYLRKVPLNSYELDILAILKLVPELDFDSIVGAVKIDPASATDALLRLVEFHIVDGFSDRFRVSPAVQTAVERDKRAHLAPERQKAAFQYLAGTLAIRLEEGTAPINLVDTAVLSSLEAGQMVPTFAAAFLLPSHYVAIAKRHYDRKHWDDSIRAAQEALRGEQRLSLNGRVAAYRYLCLSAARIGDEDIFRKGIARLEGIVNNDWVRSNVAFLEGFNFRLRGNLPSSEQYLRRSYDLSPGNLSAARELAAVCLARNRLDEAEQFAREAHSHARTNAYLLDILIAVLVRKHASEAKHISEIEDLFDNLKKADEDDNRSFYLTRKAEFEHLWGDNRRAFSLIEEAVRSTPRLFEPRRLYAAVLLKAGNKAKALEQIEAMERMVNARDPAERRSNYRSYLVMFAEYNTEIGKYPEAKAVYSDTTVFDEQEQKAAIRDIDMVQSFRQR